jgi:hypothetical protein
MLSMEGLEKVLLDYLDSQAESNGESALTG